MRPLAALLLAALLAGCGTERGPIPGLVLERLRGLTTPTAPAPDLRAVLTPQALAAIEQPLIIVDIPAAPSQAGLAAIGLNGGYVTWAAENSNLVITRGGIVTGTRGLAFDLMNAEVGGTLAALASGSGSATRVHRYVDGTGRVLARRFGCRIAPAGDEQLRLLLGTVQTRVVEETCTGALGGRFENRYWIAGGEVVKSMQWISPQIGYILIERAK